MSHMYPPIKPYHTDMLDVGDGHAIYIEQSGSPKGQPVLYMHGGPGAGLSPIYRSLFDPERFRIIGFDQRGCGNSTPFLSLENNSTPNLLQDIQRIKESLNISQWVLCGGSWGATLALMAALDDPRSVQGIILRGVFLGRDQDIDWFLSPDGGPAQLFPEFYQQFVRQVDTNTSTRDILAGYYDILTKGDDIKKAAAAKAWCLWEERISQMNCSVNEADLSHNLHRVMSLAILECHFMYQRCFSGEDILNRIKQISHIPCTIIHGRFDMVCKLEAAYTLRQAWHNSQLLIVPESGHSVSEPRIAEALCHATDAMAKFLAEEDT